MRASRLAFGFYGLTASIALALAPACAGDGEDDTGNDTINQTSGADDGSGSDAGDDGGNTTSDGGSDSMGDDAPGSTGPSDEDGMDDGPLIPDLGDPNACDPVVQGEWNACSPGGMTDNTLCNWVGNPDATGFIGCLTSSEMPGYNVCMISGCEDACDCFAPPATGDAPVICGMILADGGNACALDCSGGQTCPDGMECAGGICFHPG